MLYELLYFGRIAKDYCYLIVPSSVPPGIRESISLLSRDGWLRSEIHGLIDFSNKPCTTRISFSAYCTSIPHVSSDGCALALLGMIDLVLGPSEPEMNSLIQMLSYTEPFHPIDVHEGVCSFFLLA
jgi:hypothetical protein